MGVLVFPRDFPKMPWRLSLGVGMGVGFLTHPLLIQSLSVSAPCAPSRFFTHELPQEQQTQFQLQAYPVGQ